MAAALLYSRTVPTASSLMLSSFSRRFLSSSSPIPASSSTAASKKDEPQLLRLLQPVPKPVKPRKPNQILARTAAAKLLQIQNRTNLAKAREELSERLRGLSPVIKVEHPLPPAVLSPANEAFAPHASLRFAVISVGGTQYKVAPGDLIMPNKIEAEVGTQVTFTPLMVGSLHETLIGRPLVDKVVVRGLVEEHTDTGKVLVFKKKRRTQYKRLKGFRAQRSTIRITGIDDL